MTPFNYTPVGLRALLVGLVAACGGMGARAQSTPAAAEAPIELPKFEVTDSRLLPPPEAWRYAGIPGFEILSSISARATTRFVKDFLLLQTALDEIMPGFTRSNVVVPTSLILTGRGRDFDRFLPKDRGDDRYRTNSLFFDDPERGAIVVDFALAEIFRDDNTTEESDPYRGFYKEYFRYLIRHQMGGKVQPWFEEGLVRLFSSIDVTKKWINFAMLGDGFGGERPGDFNRELAQKALLPFPQLFAGPPLRYRNNWEAQSYAFVHMCLYGRGQKYQKGFIKFLARIGREVPTENVFKECFGLDYRQMSFELRAYIGFTDYKSVQYVAKKGQSLPEPPPFTLRDATDAESGRIVGEALRLGGHAGEARMALIAPYIRGEREARLLAALGLAERLEGNDDRARKFLEAAAKAKVERPRAYFELARLNYEEARLKPAGAEKRLSEAQVSHVVEPLLIARSQRPPMAQVYGLLAEVWSQAARGPTRGEFGVVVEGVQMFPTDGGLVWRATTLAAGQKLGKEALLLAKHGVRISRDLADRNRFEVIAQAFERDAEPVPAASKPPEPAPQH
ncbi:MAG: hypothetical protein H7343_06785 [Undibacterium sp.]|nr:hypothetical protein [Opitutaceae bacterium]